MNTRIQGAALAAQRKGRLHFSFAYSVKEIYLAKNARDAFHGDLLAIEAWINDERHWRSGTITAYIPRDDGGVDKLRLQCRDHNQRNPHDLTAQLKASLNDMYEQHPDSQDAETVVTVTCSLVRPKSLGGAA